MGNEQSNARIASDIAERLEDIVKDVALRADFGGAYPSSENLIGEGPLPEVKSLEDVRREIRSRSGSIYEHYESLQAILQRHENTIQRRWLMKSRQERLAILLSAWPNMTSSHRPDFDVFWKGSYVIHDYDGGPRERFLCPYINQEDLLVPKALLLLANSRGRNPPSLFAATDIDAMKLGRATRRFPELHIKLSSGKPALLENYFMRVNGLTENTREYGKLVARKYQPEAFDGHVNKMQCGIEEGLLLLEAQDRLLKFLVDSCHQVLHDIPQDALIGDSFPVLPEPQFKSEVTGYASLAAMAAEAPYRSPAQLDISLVQSMLSARVSALEDHLWALREDPDYFVTQLLEAKEHLMQNLKDGNGKANHPLLSDGQQPTMWAQVMCSSVGETYWNLEILSEASRLAEKVAVLQKKYATDISSSKDLPGDYLEALLLFHHFLDRAPALLQGTLWHAAPGSPPLRRMFRRQPSRSLMEEIHVFCLMKDVGKGDKIEHKLLWLLTYLWRDNDVLSLITMPVLVDELERLLQAEPSARAMLTPTVSAMVGDLSILSQCWRQINSYQPWAWTWESTLIKRRDELESQYIKRFHANSRYVSVLEPSNFIKIGALCDFSSGKFAYPFEAPRTKAKVGTLRSAELRLNAVWAAFDQVLLKAGDLRGTAADKFLSQQSILRRTRDWVESENSPPGTSIGSDSYHSYRSMSEVYTLFRSSSAQQTKKSSGLSAKAQPSFSVDARALKVFRALFFCPAITNMPHEIPWKDFLHAMRSVGLTVLKLYNSTWQFAPTKEGVKKSIQFSEPKGKISITMARVFGRRLNRAYGWNGEMFSLKEQ
ncbi:hypothetical protein BJX68DRAFT_265279 [Aspergillus pseudodeflectus]|uniref:Uncharacterized protein n=1 Tax=Aspergillus pseudodeflectus TaxID=176178 RepID=A0ABR4KL82_9EURO